MASGPTSRAVDRFRKKKNNEIVVLQIPCLTLMGNSSDAGILYG